MTAPAFVIRLGDEDLYDVVCDSCVRHRRGAACRAMVDLSRFPLCSDCRRPLPRKRGRRGSGEVVRSLLALIVLLAATTSRADVPREPDRKTVTALTRAIYLAEGGTKASVPYGVMSQRVKSTEHARRITEASIRKNWSRWRDAGCPGDFVGFMARRWAPVGAENDPRGLNRQWAENVRKLFRKLYRERS